MAKKRQYNEQLTLLINPAKKQALLEVLRIFEIGEIQSKQAIVEQYIQNAPKNVPISEAELISEVSKVRKNKKKNAA